MKDNIACIHVIGYTVHIFVTSASLAWLKSSLAPRPCVPFECHFRYYKWCLYLKHTAYIMYEVN